LTLLTTTKLAQDLQFIREWHKRIAGRASLSEDAIYARAGTAQTAEQVAAVSET
jgi:hypothetical protein